MKLEEPILINVLTGVNLGAIVVFGALLSWQMGKLVKAPGGMFGRFWVLVGVYLVEVVAFSMGMCSQVFTVGLAFVWGAIFGRWARNRAPRDEAVKTSIGFALYTVCPTASLCLGIPIAFLVTGKGVFSAEDGVAFGIPDFVPWPFNTVGGFFGAVLVVTLVAKVLITAWMVRRSMGAGAAIMADI